MEEAEMDMWHWQTCLKPKNDRSCCTSAVVVWLSRKSTCEILCSWALGTIKNLQVSMGTLMNSLCEGSQSVFTSPCTSMSGCFNCIAHEHLKESLNRAYCTDFGWFWLNVIICSLLLYWLVWKKGSKYMSYIWSIPIQEHPVVLLGYFMYFQGTSQKNNPNQTGAKGKNSWQDGMPQEQSSTAM